MQEVEAASIEAIARDASISPPPSKRRRLSKSHEPTSRYKPHVIDLTSFDDGIAQATPETSSGVTEVRLVPSPIQLNFIPEFPASSNKDTTSLGNVLGDPLISECWLFNYLFDIDFIMSQFDPDVKSLVRVKIVHGSWRSDDANGIGIEQGARKYPNIQNIKAYLPEPFGTHHSKMIILFRHDDLAQVVITTGNFIEKDWSMSQAFWCSPLLPSLNAQDDNDMAIPSNLPALGSGKRFKHDLLAYIRSYGSRLSDLTAQIQRYDFSSVKGALVASVPGKQNLRSIDQGRENLWGLPALKRALSQVPSPGNGTPHIVTQVSSVASIGEKWLKDTFFPALGTNKKPPSQSSQNTSPAPKYSLIFPTSSEIRLSIDGYASGSSIHMKTQTPAQAKQLEYLRPMLCHWAPLPRSVAKPPIFNLPRQTPPSDDHMFRHPRTRYTKANRHPAAPHIKTYIRFSSPPSHPSPSSSSSSSSSSNPSKTPSHTPTIDWALLTSANLSTQAWGSAPNASGEVRVCSYEIGICFWGALWDDDADPTERSSENEARNSRARMVPVFPSNTPDAAAMHASAPEAQSTGSPTRERAGLLSTARRTAVTASPSMRDPVIIPTEAPNSDNTLDKENGEMRNDEHGKGDADVQTLVGWRMPYDLPLVPYQEGEMPWCATQACEERDWMGRVWKGYGR